MKRILTTLALTLFVSSAAQAACYKFINGRGPSTVGSVNLAAPATQVCTYNTSRTMGGSHASVSFADGQGVLAEFAAQEIGRGRCAGVCSQLQLSYGNANGVNVSAEGVVITIQVEGRSNLSDYSAGTLSIDGQRYLISE